MWGHLGSSGVIWGHLEKTDRLDAKVIAHYFAIKALQPMPLPSEKQRRLSALSARMRQVVSDMTVQKQRLHSASRDVAKNGLLELIGVLKRQSKSLGKSLSAEIASLIAADPLWAKIDAVLRSVKGVAGRTVATLMADLPELGSLSNGAISKIVGVAPSPMTAANAPASAAPAVVAPESAAFSSSSLTSSANTIRACRTSATDWSQRVKKRWSSASPSPTNFSSDPMPKSVK